jgi:hypothetical protein
MKKKGPLSTLASEISGKTDDASGGKAAVRAAAAKAVADTKAPRGKGKPKKVALADAGVADAAKPSKAPTKVAAKPKAKTEPRTTLYDWSAAEAKAKAGTVPPTPPFASYGPHMKKAHDMAKAGQAKELREYLAGFSHDPVPPSRKNLFRYGELCASALKASGAGKRA